ncbi:MAG: molybdopterin-guanine dinucleotide biosynthesis protein B [Methanobacteriota archaeon]|nr:MAG: molybdopterin-guanine dinucleotide biosynthesis protein B [Euryarchaeota archaeon]
MKRFDSGRQRLNNHIALFNAMKMISVVGEGRNSGKTTAVEELVREFKRRGLKVGTIKQIHEPDFTIDTVGKDSWRHAEAGADIVVSAAPGEVAAIKRLRDGDRVKEALALLRGLPLDLVIIEGDPGLEVPMVYAARGGDRKGAKPVDDKVVCMVSLTPERVRGSGLPVFHIREDVSRVADLLLKTL